MACFVARLLPSRPTILTRSWREGGLDNETLSLAWRCRPHYLFNRKIQSTSVFCKKRKTGEEKKMPRIIQYNPKSKWKAMEVIEVNKVMTVKELATALGKDVDHVFEVMRFVDDSVNYNKPSSVIDNFKVIEQVALKSGKRCKLKEVSDNEHVKEFHDAKRRNPSEYIKVLPRPPVVTIMGHVDHGKTTLLDTLRSSSVVASEFGGITQHIGAFSVGINEKNRITFLDTPGHAAFCSMRNRGAQCTDIVVLVVAADDGVMEQTVESIKMAKNAGVPIIVAINKIDKPQADVERTKKMLVQHGVQVEDYGGDTQVVPISALKNKNIDTLIDAILVQAELMELKSDYEGPVEGVVIESSTDPHRGKLCTLLIQCGTLKKGSILVAGSAWGKVRTLFNDAGEIVNKATPSSPVQTLGWRGLPSAGDEVLEVSSEKRANEVVDWRKTQESLKKQEEDKEVIDKKMEEHYIKYREQLENKRKLGKRRLKPSGPRQKLYTDDTSLKLHVIIKGDVNGSVEAILDVIDTYDSNMCMLDVVHYGVGPVSLNDVVLAKTFSAIIYTFNTTALEDAKTESKSCGISIKNHNVIYKLIDDIKVEINKLLPLKDVEEVIGEANVLQQFLITEGKSKVPVAGCRCVKGHLKKSGLFKLVRNGEVLYAGGLSSLRHLKNEVDTIKKDIECGVRLADPEIHAQPGDTIVCYKVNKVPQEVNWNPGF